MKKSYRIFALRGRSNGKWTETDHFQKLEVGGTITLSYTRGKRQSSIYNI